MSVLSGIRAWDHDRRRVHARFPSQQNRAPQGVVAESVTARLTQRGEQRLIQAFVAQSADEALGNRVLLRLAGCLRFKVDLKAMPNVTLR